MSKPILLIGEPMGLFIANTVGALEDVDTFTLTTCGAELNVAIGLKRLGQDVAYFTKVADDPFGRKIVNMMKKTGIATDTVQYSDDHPTGFMFKEKVTEGDPGIFYFRKGSAASTLSPEDVDKIDFSRYALVHMTGITPALTDSTRAATEAVFKKAKGAGIPISFDPNLRPQLWPSKAAMAGFINKMAAQSDLFLPGENETAALIGEKDAEKAAAAYLDMGAKKVVVKTGASGAYYADAKGSRGHVPGFKVDKVVDTVGAGDGFAAGTLAGLAQGLSMAEAVHQGCAVGAIQVMSVGDNDGLPTVQELGDFMAGKPDWRA
ncbi:MAG: sugar kinase [Pseudoramibacter sp.]